MQGSHLSWLLAALVPFTLGQTIDVDGEAVRMLHHLHHLQIIPFFLIPDEPSLI
jgi:hypothetical protein